MRRESRDVVDAAGHVGRVARSSRLTEVAAPVRVDANTGLVAPMTITSSEIVASVELERDVLNHTQIQR